MTADGETCESRPKYVTREFRDLKDLFRWVLDWIYVDPEMVLCSYASNCPLLLCFVGLFPGVSVSLVSVGFTAIVQIRPDAKLRTHHS